MNIPDPLPCRCALGTSNASGTETSVLPSPKSCGEAFEVFLHYEGQSVIVFYGDDEFSVGGISLETPGTITIKTTQNVGSNADVLVCANEGKYFCCSDDYNWDGIIDHFDSAIYKCWIEEGEPTDLTILQQKYKNRVDSKTGWPDTVPCKIPSIPCADFDITNTTSLDDSDMHTGATHLFGNVKAETPPTDGFTTGLYYPTLQQHAEWSSEDMLVLPSQFSTQFLNDQDECPTTDDFAISVECSAEFSDVCLYSENDIETDRTSCIYQNDLDFSFIVNYDGPFIQLEKIKYALISEGRAKTDSNNYGLPLRSLLDLKSLNAISNDEEEPPLPCKVTHSKSGDEYYSCFRGEIVIDDTCDWTLNIYTENPDCTIDDSYVIIKTLTHKCADCDSICEKEYPDYTPCDP